MKFTLITGGCKGIGKAIAYECASRQMNVLLVSNDGDCLHAVRNDIRKTMQVECHCLEVDLSQEGATTKVLEWIAREKYDVDVLVNNVGIGRGGIFSTMDLSDIHRIIHLNNRVMIEMTYHLLPMLEKHNEAYIINISSLEATLPLPYKAVYTATKNFVYAFSLAIGEELKFGNVKVSVVCPGPVLTNADGLSRIQAHGARSKILLMYPDKVARIAITGMLKHKKVIVPGVLNTIFFTLGSWLPVQLKMPLLEKLFRVYKTT